MWPTTSDPRRMQEGGTEGRDEGVPAVLPEPAHGTSAVQASLLRDTGAGIDPSRQEGRATDKLKVN